MDITEQLLNTLNEWDEKKASPDDFFSHVEDWVVTELLEQEELSSNTAANEKNALSWCSQAAKFGQFGYVVTGIWLDRLRQWKHLWQRKAKKFGDFCFSLIGKGSWYATRLIKAAKVCLALVKQGFKVLPTCEAQARPLTKYLTENDPILGDVCSEEMFDKWQEVIDRVPPKKNITANHVSAIVDGEEQSAKSVKIDASTLERLERLAHKAGMSKQEYLQYLLDKEEKKAEAEPTETEASTEEVEPAKMQVWEADVRELVTEHDSNTSDGSKSANQNQHPKFTETS